MKKSCVLGFTAIAVAVILTGCLPTPPAWTTPTTSNGIYTGVIGDSITVSTQNGKIWELAQRGLSPTTSPLRASPRRSPQRLAPPPTTEPHKSVPHTGTDHPGHRAGYQRFLLWQDSVGDVADQPAKLPGSIACAVRVPRQTSTPLLSLGAFRRTGPPYNAHAPRASPRTATAAFM